MVWLWVGWCLECIFWGEGEGVGLVVEGWWKVCVVSGGRRYVWWWWEKVCVVSGGLGWGG